jgi:superfamily II DNA or RNA helicase
MRLDRSTRHQFSEVDRSRGEAYYANRRALIEQYDRAQALVAATVQGSSAEPYEVLLDLERIIDESLGIWCSCPRFADRSTCKHVWAVLRELTDHPPHRPQMSIKIEVWPIPNSVASRLKQCLQGMLTREDARARIDRAYPGSLTEPSQPLEIAPVTQTLKAWSARLDRSRLRLDHSIHPRSADAIVCSEPTWFVIDAGAAVDAARLNVTTWHRQRKKNGEYGSARPAMIERGEISALKDPHERRLMQLLLGGELYQRTWRTQHDCQQEYPLPIALAEDLLPQLVATGRFGWSLMANRSFRDFHPLDWDGGPPWELLLRFESVPGTLSQRAALDAAASRVSSRVANGAPQGEASASATNADSSSKTAPLAAAACCLRGYLVRDTDRVPIERVVASVPEGWLLLENCLGRIRPADVPVLQLLQREPLEPFDVRELPAVVEQLARLPDIPRIELPAGHEDLVVWGERPRPRIRISSYPSGNSRDLTAKVTMRYGELEVPPTQGRMGTWDADRGALRVRDVRAELAACAPLWEFSFTRRTYNAPGGYESQLQFPARELPRLVAELTALDWEVIADGDLLRRPSHASFSVSSNRDWFEVEAELRFGESVVGVPALLEALRKRNDFVILDDGSRGMLPEEWLERFAGLAEMGASAGETLRFGAAQTLLLDALLADPVSEACRSEVRLDAMFRKFRARLQDFRGIEPARAPRGFRGELRAYQQEGLGWLKFLRDFGLGGCLADDMGLGKTVQVLAMLQSRRTRRLAKDELRRPSIVVVPRSLVFNWLDEAARFAPRLKVVNYTGGGRHEVLAHASASDLVVTTYGTLRRDILQLQEMAWDYAILDESQAIKNPNSQAAKACRLLQAQHRLAMTGTPIENHLGELWSLIDFLNPGMLGRVAAFRKLLGSGDNNPTRLAQIRQAVQPLMLRRTKDQVLTELPQKTEQTLVCDLSRKQRAFYDDLESYYRAQIADKVEELGLAKAKIHVLEALLRLRQTACDPRLLDRKQTECGAKIKMLLEQLEELRAEGHKALVFSQFTQMLALVKPELEARGWTYEYLDGKTRDRAAKVRRFQADDACGLFLISLKAGGSGLNLTAADYVFILDPWWNPAVEAQAVDRAHRIGQHRPVTAYRIVCRDTIEDKILQLQHDKQQLADAIISSDKSVLGKLTTSDLQVLLGAKV